MIQFKKYSLFVLIILLGVGLNQTSFGLDTDLYVLSGVNIPPNVLIILDNSASMDEVASGQVYDTNIDYSQYSPSTIYPRNAVYIKQGGNWVLWADDVNTISCNDLKDKYLIPYGEAINYSGCGLKNKDFQTGNFRNYLQLTGGPGGSRPRFGLANGIIHSYINTTNGVRFAVMIFNNDKTGKTVKYNKDLKIEYVDNPNGNEDAEGGRVIGFVDENKNGKTALFNELSGLKNETWSPLAETLLMAKTYFQSGLNGFSSPVHEYCQKNYVLIISDGDPTKDTGSLPEIAEQLFKLDLSNGKSSTGQNIKTYTIGFSITHSILEETARRGGGRYFYVWSSQSFNIAFQTFIAEVLKESTSYVAPVVPISQMERTSSGNRMFLAMFKPTERSFWKGNIKKYGIYTGSLDDSCLSKNLNIGDIVDVRCEKVMNELNQIKQTAQSYWSSKADGEEVEKGGVGEKLLERDFSTNPRKIYTYLGNPNLTDSSNVFNKTNITPQMLGLSQSDTTIRDRIIDFIYGWDVYDENRNNKTDEKREWILGAFIHSRPVVVHYDNVSVIYAGANDGMLHAFHNGVKNGNNWTDGTGEEIWAFIPPSLLPNLKNLNGEQLQFFVDGSPKVFIGKDNSGNDVKYLIFGLRRGGNRYIALDITDPYSPKWLWEISPSSSGFGELGQTWSTPQIGKIKYGTESSWVTKWVFFIGGGYDENQDLANPGNDSKGRAVYVVDVLTGSLIWSYTYAKNSQMKYCIPSDIARVDTNGDGYIDRLYVGDMGGRIWRFDIGNPNPQNWTGKIIFNSNPGGSEKRKIFYPPDVTLENDSGNYEMLFFGTGDREAPKEKTVINRLYAIKDKNPSTPLTENDLVNVTNQAGDLNTLKTKNGWYIVLENTGEKSLSTSVVFNGVVYYTTFTPSFGQDGDICFLGEGTGRLYALKYKTGNAAFDFDKNGVLSLTGKDRWTFMGEEEKTTIPSGVIITFIGGNAVAYAGVGGGVFIPPLPSTKSLFPVNWRIKF